MDQSKQPKQLNSQWGWVLGLALLATPAMAHEVELSGNVGGTLHIEPNDTPRTDQPSQAWFALTRRGGQAIPLSQCECRLAVYAQPYQSGDEPIAQPSLSAITTEGQPGIPGATLQFPRAGAYELILSGRPTTSGTFTPFQLRFSVIVAR